MRQKTNNFKYKSSDTVASELPSEDNASENLIIKVTGDVTSSECNTIRNGFDSKLNLNSRRHEELK